MSTHTISRRMYRTAVVALAAAFLFTGFSVEYANAGAAQTPGNQVTKPRRKVRRHRRRRVSRRLNTPPAHISISTRVTVLSSVGLTNNEVSPATSASRLGTTNYEVLPGGVGTAGEGSVAADDDAPPPVVPPSTPRKTVVSGGILNGRAISLPRPVYPETARATHASGAVSVQATIDEQGNVISAIAVSGPVLLRASAVSAARRAKFSPTKLAGEPVKVTGTIIYNFTAQ